MIKNKYLNNILILLFSQCIVKCVGIVYKLYLTNKTGYGDIGNALFSSSFQVYAVFLTICSIGVPNAISTLVSEKFAEGKTKGAYRILKIAIVIFGTLGFGSSCTLYFFAKKIAYDYLQIPETEMVLKTLSPSIFIVGVTSVLKGYFNGKQKIDITAKAMAIEQIVKTVFTIIFVEIIANISNSNTIILVCTVGITATFGDIISFAYIYIKYKKTKKEIWTDIITSKYDEEERKRHVIKCILKVSLPIALCALIATTNKTIDAMTVVRLAKEYLGEKEAIKQYGILSGKVESILVLPLSFNVALTTTLIPTVSMLKAKKELVKAKNILKLSIIIGIIIGILCISIILVFSEDILKLFFPNASDGSNMLKYSSIIILTGIITQTINSYLQGLHKMSIQMISIGIGSIVKLVLNIFLIKYKQLGVYGAITSNVMSNIISLLILYIYLIRKERISFEITRFLIKPGVLFFVISIILKKIQTIKIFNIQLLNLGIKLFVGLIMYFIIVIFLKMVSKKDLQIVDFGKHKTRK